MPQDMKKGYFKVKILELLMFLNSLDMNLSQTERRSCSRTHVELAKKVCGYINEHMDTRLTIEQLAARFFVSSAQLKKAFTASTANPYTPMSGPIRCSRRPCACRPQDSRSRK